MQENQNNATNEAAVDETINAAASEQTVEQTAEQRIAALEAQLAELQDQLLRSRADQENQRRRNAEELLNTQKYAINKFAQELVPVKDYLEMAQIGRAHV